MIEPYKRIGDAIMIVAIFLLIMTFFMDIAARVDIATLAVMLHQGVEIMSLRKELEELEKYASSLTEEKTGLIT